MTALVQSFPQQSSTLTMLQTRPTSAPGVPFQTGLQSQQHLRNSQMSKGIYGGNNAVTSYRGHTSIPPVAPYAFTATPVTSQGGNPLRQNPTTPYLRQENRTISAPVMTFSQQANVGISPGSTRQRQPDSCATVVPLPDNASAFPSYNAGTRDDSAIATPRTTVPRPLSAMELNISDAKLSAMATPTKASPDRYRRTNQRRAEPSQSAATFPLPAGSALPSGSGMATVGYPYSYSAQSTSSPVHQLQTYRGTSMLPNYENPAMHTTQLRHMSKDDTALNRQSSSEQAKRYRRRSVGVLELGDFNGHFTDPREQVAINGQSKTYASVISAPYIPERQDIRAMNPVPMSRPLSFHDRNGNEGSSGSLTSNSRPSSVRYL